MEGLKCENLAMEAGPGGPDRPGQWSCSQEAGVLGWGVCWKQAVPLASGPCFLEIPLGSQALLPSQFNTTLVSPWGEPSFPQKTADDGGPDLMGGREVISRLFLLIRAVRKQTGIGQPHLLLRLLLLRHINVGLCQVCRQAPALCSRRGPSAPGL